MTPSPASGDDNRPQEPPRKRRRVALACDRCRDRKIKCDGAKPICRSCQQLQQRQPTEDIGFCKYQRDSLKFVYEREYIDGLHSRIRDLEHGRENRPTADTATESIFSSNIVGELDVTQSTSERDPAQIPTQKSPREERRLGMNSSNPVFSNHFDSCSQISINDDSSPQPVNQGRSENALSWNNPYSAVNGTGPSPSATIPTESDENISAMGGAAATDTTFPVSGAEFYGASSAISVFNQIQDSFNGSRKRKEPIQLGSMSGGDHGMHSDVRLHDLYLPPRPFADFLLNSYWEQVHSLYPIVHKSSFLTAYHQLWVPVDSTREERPGFQVGLGSSTCPISVFHCGLNAMFALGCNLSDMPYEQRRAFSDAFCQRSLDLALRNLLDNSSLALVQALFILGQFLQSTDYPTRCWNVVGLALRVAQGIGLYLDTPSLDQTLLETEIKRRTWHSCLLLDIITSMTLGRPALASREASVPLPAAVDDKYLECENPTLSLPPGVFSEDTTFFVQTLKLYAIFGEVLTHVYKPWQDRSKEEQMDSRRVSNIIGIVMSLENDLSEFKSNLPPQLNWDSQETRTGEPWLLERQRNILYTRYLHLKVLLYRPIFHQFCAQSQRSHLMNQLSGQKSFDKTIISSVIQSYATACIESAQQLITFINTSSRTRAAGAWWYAIFYMFSCAMILILAGAEWIGDTVAKDTIEQSWQSCLETLEHLASKHVRARTCAKTLMKLREQGVAAQNAICNSQNARADEISADKNNQGSSASAAWNTENSPRMRSFYDDAVEFYDPLLQDVLWQQPEDSQLPWDLTDADWWQGMLKRP